MTLPLNPTADRTSYRTLGMGTIGWAISGGTFYDHRSSPEGDLAAYYEWDTLDYSYGHSDNNNQYHYHAVGIFCKNTFLSS